MKGIPSSLFLSGASTRSLVDSHPYRRPQETRFHRSSTGPGPLYRQGTDEEQPSARRQLTEQSLRNTLAGVHLVPDDGVIPKEGARGGQEARPKAGMLSMASGHRVGLPITG